MDTLHLFQTAFDSPIGRITLTATENGINSLYFNDLNMPGDSNSEILGTCVDELERYFAGKLTRFSVPLDFTGSEFQLRVWNQLLQIPYGQVITYSDLGKRVGGTTFTRIAGQANARNPVAILVPCHRVVGMKGALTGYAGGIWRKKYLLDLEQRGGNPDFSPTLF